MDDVTIEDEWDSNEQTMSPKESTSSFLSFLSQLSQSWQVLVFCICLTIGWFIARKRRQQQQQQTGRQVSGNSSGEIYTNDSDVLSFVFAADEIDRNEQMERTRQRQQKQYEEQSRRYLEAKQAVSDRSRSK
jgi:flagellar biosynthesis/type III secretory pathway M-ring protein FliF/YscJ